MEIIMKKTAIAMATAAILGSSVALAGGHAKTVKLGVVLGFTGPAESLAESMARGAELAMKGKGQRRAALCHLPRQDTGDDRHRAANGYGGIASDLRRWRKESRAIRR